MTALSGSYSTSFTGSLARERVTDNSVQHETHRDESTNPGTITYKSADTPYLPSYI